MNNYLQETPEFDFSHPDIQSLIKNIKPGSDKKRSIELYYAIRDGIRYNPYTFVDGKRALKASYAATNNDAYCIPKSTLMVAACRAIGIPARLGLANVRNHLASKKLLDFLKSDLFVMHGYAEIKIENKWVKCTPVFNKEMCDRFGVPPLEFDGENDSIFHSFGNGRSSNMEYIKDHGSFANVPVDFIFKGWEMEYPHILFSDLA
jgi:transglutaminase-like putative cysteine protease